MFGKIPTNYHHFYKEFIENYDEVDGKNFDLYKETVGVTGQRMGESGRKAFHGLMNDHVLVSN
jgi:hypothetical protein